MFDYNNNREYRQLIRSIVEMNPDVMDTFDSKENLDEETIDEFNFDMEKLSSYLDRIYVQTQNHPVFQEVYSTAAAKMISLDNSVGLAVLMSYDYLKLFLNMLRDFSLFGDSYDRSFDSYISLEKKIK